MGAIPSFGSFLYIFQYVKLGGNLLLLTRQGQDFIDEEFKQYLGIQWREETVNTINNCIAVYPGLQDITVLPYNASGHTLVAVFSTLLTDTDSQILFEETASFSYDRGLGVWKKPSTGGQYRADGGQVVFISGRPYRMEPSELKFNVEYILSNFLNISSVPQKENIPVKFSLEQNYPNPFNAQTIITYSLPQLSDIKLDIFDILGKHIKTLVNKKMPEGVHKNQWDGTNNKGVHTASGIYYVRLITNDYTETRKIIYLR